MTTRHSFRTVLLNRLPERLLHAVRSRKSHLSAPVRRAGHCAGTGIMTVALGLLAFKIAGDKAGTVLGTALAIKMIAYVGA